MQEQNEYQFDHVLMLIDINDGPEDEVAHAEAQRQILEYLKLISVESLDKMTTTTTAAMHIIRFKPGTIPVKQKARRIMYHFQKKFDKTWDRSEDTRLNSSH